MITNLKCPSCGHSIRVLCRVTAGGKLVVRTPFDGERLVSFNAHVRQAIADSIREYKPSYEEPMRYVLARDVAARIGYPVIATAELLAEQGLDSQRRYLPDPAKLTKSEPRQTRVWVLPANWDKLVTDSPCEALQEVDNAGPEGIKNAL